MGGAVGATGADSDDNDARDNGLIVSWLAYVMSAAPDWLDKVRHLV